MKFKRSFDKSLPQWHSCHFLMDNVSAPVLSCLLPCVTFVELREEWIVWCLDAGICQIFAGCTVSCAAIFPTVGSFSTERELCALKRRPGSFWTPFKKILSCVDFYDFLYVRICIKLQEQVWPFPLIDETDLKKKRKIYRGKIKKKAHTDMQQISFCILSTP